MRLVTATMALALFFAMTVPVCSAGAPNVAIEVGSTDLCATIPLCTYWYTDGETGITPLMTVTNNGHAPIAVSGPKLLNGESTLREVPRNLAPSGQASFVLYEKPKESIIHMRTAKYAVIFTISRTGE